MKRIVVLALLLVVVVSFVCCSQLSGPSDAEIIKLIESQVNGSRPLQGTYKLTSPVQIIERGSVIKDIDGRIYPVKVRYAYSVSFYGTIKPHKSKQIKE